MQQSSQDAENTKPFLIMNDLMLALKDVSIKSKILSACALFCIPSQLALLFKMTFLSCPLLSLVQGRGQENRV